AEVDRALEARDLLRRDLVDQLRPHPQPRLDLRARARCHLHPRTDLAHQRALVAAGTAQRGQRERAGVVRARDPGGEEVVLEHGDPAAGHLLVAGAVLMVYLDLALPDLVHGAVTCPNEEA